MTYQITITFQDKSTERHVVDKSGIEKGCFFFSTEIADVIIPLDNIRYVEEWKESNGKTSS